MPDIRRARPGDGLIALSHPPVLGTPSRSKLLESTLAFILLALLGMRLEINQALTLGDVAALALSPVWLFHLRFYRWAGSLMALGATALLLGFWLCGFSAADHDFDRISYFNNSVVFGGLFLSIGTILWARTLMPQWLVGVAFGAGLALGVSGTGRAAENLWKFGYAIPSTIVVLSLVGYADSKWGLNRRLADLGLLLAVALLSGASDGRSLFGLLMLAFVLVLWQLIPQGRTARRAVAKTMLAFAGMVLVIYNVGTSLLLDGYLGAEAQHRSAEQISLSGSLLLGGRPEMAATAALFQSHPWGFGVGIRPSLDDILIAKTGMAAIHYEPNNGYVEHYMFGTHFELHSVLGDFWVLFGLAGMAFALLVLVLMTKWIVASVARRRASGLVIFLCILTLWNIPFSPMYTSVPTMALAVGLVLSRKTDDSGWRPLPERKNRLQPA